jgi:hypothetical protein
MTSKEIRAEIRAVKAEMKERGIKTVSCFNGGLDDGTYRANSKLYRLKVAMDEALKAESSPKVPWVEVDQETAYGSRQRLSRSIRVF